MNTTAGRVEDLAAGWRRRFGPARRSLAAPLAVGLAVVLWVAAAQIGAPGRGPGGPAPTAGGTARPSATGSSRPTPAPRMEVVGGSQPRGSLAVRNDGLRELDLTTGGLGERLFGRDNGTQVLRLPDGVYVCVCPDRKRVGAATEFSLTLSRRGEAGTVTELGRWTARMAPGIGTAQQGDSVATQAAMSPDGRLIVVGVAIRSGPAWERSLVVVDVRRDRVIEDRRLADVPAVGGGVAVYAWAPGIAFSPDGRHVLVTAAVLTGDRITEQGTWVATTTGTRLGALESLSGPGRFGDGPCTEPWVRWGDARTLYAVCMSPTGDAQVLRRVGVDGRSLGDVDLRAALGGGWPFQLVDRERGVLYLWDPFSFKGTRIDLAGGRVTATTTVSPETGAVDPARALASIAEWLAPRAAAKTLLDPALALSPDGTRLYVVGLGGGSTPYDPHATAVFVLDAANLKLLERWPIDGEATSIAVGEEGRVVYLTYLPSADASGTPTGEARLEIRRADGGSLEARYGRLGTLPLLLATPEQLLGQ